MSLRNKLKSEIRKQLIPASQQEHLHFMVETHLRELHNEIGPPKNQDRRFATLSLEGRERVIGLQEKLIKILNILSRINEKPRGPIKPPRKLL